MDVLSTFVLEDLFRVHYVVPHQPDEFHQASPFLAFLPGILSTYGGFVEITAFPQNIIELFIDQTALISQRIAKGGYLAIPLRLEAVRVFLQRINPSFCVILSANAEIAKAVETILADHSHPILHVTPPGIDVGVHVGDNHRQLFDNMHVGSWPDGRPQEQTRLQLECFAFLCRKTVTLSKEPL